MNNVLCLLLVALYLNNFLYISLFHLKHILSMREPIRVTMLFCYFVLASLYTHYLVFLILHLPYELPMFEV